MNSVVTTILTDERARTETAVEQLLIKSINAGQWWL